MCVQEGRLLREELVEELGFGAGGEVLLFPDRNRETGEPVEKKKVKVTGYERAHCLSCGSSIGFI